MLAIRPRATSVSFQTTSYPTHRTALAVRIASILNVGVAVLLRAFVPSNSPVAPRYTGVFLVWPVAQLSASKAVPVSRCSPILVASGAAS